MADHSEVAYTTADGNDYVAHEQNYEGFLMLVKWGTISVAILLALMAYFLVRSLRSASGIAVQRRCRHSCSTRL